MKSLILGYGLSGKAIESYLVSKKRDYLIYDENPEHIPPQFLFKEEYFNDIEIAYVSPGIPPTNKLFIKLKKNKIRVLTDLDIFFNELNNNNICSIGVTGTNGKTTFVTILSKFLKSLNLEAYAIGNIGRSPLEILEEVNQQNKRIYLIFEISSFQLYHSDALYFDIGVLLNISKDHLDWHKDFNDYVASKNKIFTFTKTLSGIVKELKVNEVEKLNPNLSLFIKELRKKGFHIDTVLSFFKVLYFLELLENNSKKAFDFLMNLDQFDHRFEILNSSSKRIYINDSKATNLDAVNFAIGKLNNIDDKKDRKKVLILHGDNKGVEFSELNLNKIDVLIKPKKTIVNQTSEVEIYNYKKLKNEIEFILNQVPIDSVILFSCGGSSFTEFNNYMDRGQFFKDVVKKLEV